MKLAVFASYSILVLVPLLVSGATIDAAEPAPKPTGAEAKAAASKWLDSLGKKGLVLDERKAMDPFAVKYGPSAVGHVTTFRYRTPGWWVSFTFRGEVTADTPIETLRKQFWHVALDRLPTPGLNLPGWEVRPQTPSSSFSKGVKILAYGDGRITFQVKTRFFALYGRDPTILVPADAPSPPGSYFQIRKEFPLDLKLDAPVVFP